MPTILGVNFGRDFFLGGGGPETLEKQFARKIRWKNLLRNSPAILLKFARPE